MPTRYITEPGDCIASIAERFGLNPITIWDHSENAELKRLRGNPNVLAVGDAVFIPDLRRKTVPVATGQVHRFVRPGVPAKYRLRLLENGHPRARLPYVLQVEALTFEGETNEQGWLEHWIPPSATAGTLTLGDNEVYPLKIGTLAPVATEEGVRQRLRNLGYLESDLAAGVRRFQEDTDLEPTGELTDQDRESLVAAHGS